MKDILKYSIWAGLGAILVVPFIVADGMFFPYITGKNFTFRIIVEIILGLWLILIIKNKEFRPKWSWLLGCAGLFAGVMLVADINAVAPFKAFWSNYERMEGWVTVGHLVAYLLVFSSMLNTEKMWRWFFRVSVAMSSIMAVMALQEIITKGIDRVAGPLGNPIYISIYFLFNFFFILILLYKDVLEKRTDSWSGFKGIWTSVLFYVYSIVGLLSVYLVYKTSRGVMLGLIGGLFFAMVVLAISEKKKVVLRQISIGGIILIVVLVGAFISIRNTSFVKNNSTLARFAEISWSNINGQARQLVWPMAIKGIKEKPILGWGQDGFNYVFNKYYDPKMYAQEQWFDRAHNTSLDYLVAGGILGFLAYISLFGAALYLLWFRRNSLQLSEKALVTGLFAGYYFQSMFVFDNLVSYILFFATLAYVHSRTVNENEEVPVLKNAPDKKVSNKIQNQQEGFWAGFLGNEEYQNYIFIPAIMILTAVGVYWVNIPGIMANKTLIAAISEQKDAKSALANFKLALSYHSMADSEIREQLAAYTPRVLAAAGVDNATKKEFAEFTFDQLKQQIERTPFDARYQFFTGAFLNNIGNPQLALPYLEKAVEESPNKQTMRFELISNLLTLNKKTEALEQAKFTYDLEPAYQDARMMYAAVAIINHQENISDSLLAGATTTDNKINRAYLIVASESYLVGDKAKAVSYINKSIKINPDYKADGEKIIQGIWAGTVKFE